MPPSKLHWLQLCTQLLIHVLSLLSWFVAIHICLSSRSHLSTIGWRLLLVQVITPAASWRVRMSHGQAHGQQHSHLVWVALLLLCCCFVAGWCSTRALMRLLSTFTTSMGLTLELLHRRVCLWPRTCLTVSITKHTDSQPHCASANPPGHCCASLAAHAATQAPCTRALRHIAVSVPGTHLML
jgi:hypothetical protein